MCYSLPASSSRSTLSFKLRGRYPYPDCYFDSCLLTTSLLALPSELLLSIVEYLDSEADINSFLQTNCRLHALLLGHLYRCNIKLRPSFCLHWAADHGVPGAAKEAIAQGADVNSAMAFKQHEDHEGWGLGFPMRPLCRAVARGHKELVVALLDAGADFAASETDDRLDCSAMTEALMATNALVEIVQALIDRGADVNQWHHVEWTPLIQAVINDDLEIAKLLLDNGADPNMEDAGYTPIEIGIHHGRPAVVQMLREHGALTVEERLFPGYR